jgi:hypothetical protein
MVTGRRLTSCPELHTAKSHRRDWRLDAIPRIVGFWGRIAVADKQKQCGQGFCIY